MKKSVREYMTADLETLQPADTLYDAVRLELRLRIRHFPIVENGALVGILTDRDIKRAMPSVLGGTDRDKYQELMETTQVGQIMTKAPTTVSPDASLRSAVVLMAEKKFGGLPVVDGEKLVGIVTETDLLRAFAEMLAAE